MCEIEFLHIIRNALQDSSRINRGQVIVLCHDFFLKSKQQIRNRANYHGSQA